MRGKDLLQNIAEVDNDLILEAERALHRKKKMAPFKHWIAVAACLCICFCSIVPALAAAGNQLAYEMLYSISPSLAQKLKPVNVSCEENGIEMTVVAAEIDGENANILVAMRDTTGERLDETTDLFDSYSINTPYDQISGCSMVGYDAATKTATFMLTIEQMNHVLIPGDKITFSVRQLLSQKDHSSFELVQINPEKVHSITEFVTGSEMRGGSFSGGESEDNQHLMKPDEANATQLKNGVTLTGYGMVDGKLHIQLRYDDILHTDNHGYVYLKTKDGEVLDCEAGFSFWDADCVNSYEEYVFPVTAEELEGYEIWGEFWTCSGAIKGDWQVTFPLEEKE